jgi:aryl-alcohol dehydrogenase-like predicted oxidoreductase
VVEASLQRLKVQTIDLLYQHRVDPNARPWFLADAGSQKRTGPG